MSLLGFVVRGCRNGAPLLRFVPVLGDSPTPIYHTLTHTQHPSSLSSPPPSSILPRLPSSQISTHDSVFLLTDTRESRWLPTLLAAKHDKLVINSALGFDTFVVMRHGHGPTAAPAVPAVPAVPAAPAAPEEGETKVVEEGGSIGTEEAATTAPPPARSTRVGCYFCNDVVAPANSVRDRTLDQQCTVTRPGLAPIAGALAVEMLVGVLHHPLRHRAPAETSAGPFERMERRLGIIPHQIRG